MGPPASIPYDSPDIEVRALLACIETLVKFRYWYNNYQGWVQECWRHSKIQFSQFHGQAFPRFLNRNSWPIFFFAFPNRIKNLTNHKQLGQVLQRGTISLSAHHFLGSPSQWNTLDTRKVSPSEFFLFIFDFEKPKPMFKEILGQFHVQPVTC